jgi:hypothetical protein
VPELDAAKCDAGTEGHNAHATAAQTITSSTPARTRRTLAPAVGDNGSIMVTV